MEKIKTFSTSPHSSKLLDPFVIEETATTRKVLYADMNDVKKESGETVGITIVHQRRKSKNDWEDVKSISLNSLKGGEGVKLDLGSKNTRIVYDRLTMLYALVDEKGVESGIKSFTVAGADEILKVPKDRKVFIDRLLAENYGEEVWHELVNSNPDLATKLSRAKLQADRWTALQEFEENLKSNNPDEKFWQDFFTRNAWIFGYGLNFQFLDIITDQPDYGGRDYTGKGSQKGDFLMQTKAAAKYTVLVEIKTPATPLLSYTAKEPRHVKNPRNDVWLLSSDLLGAISQVQVNARTWALNSQSGENIRVLETQNIFSVEPKGILIIGNTREFITESIAACFESYRRNTFNPEIITYDELYERARFIVQNDQ